jgi:prolipoprotein diacylglyceryltransferase
MTIHFHVGRTPYTFTVHRREKDQERQLEEVTAALVWYSLLPIAGARARYVLRRWAGGAR